MGRLGQGQNAPPIGFNVPPQPPPPYPDVPTNYQYPPQQPHIIYPIISSPLVGPKPLPMICPFCHQHIITRTHHQTSLRTHLMAVLLCMIGCWACFWMPYVMETCKTANHHCPNCGAFVGTHRDC